MKNKLLIVIFVCASIFWGRASIADIIRFKNGMELEGLVTEETEKAVVVEMGYGTMTFTPDEIESIEKKPFSAEEGEVRSAEPDAKEDLIDYKGRKYTKERFQNLVKQKGLVHHNGRWMSGHEKLGLDIEQGAAGIDRNQLIRYASAAVAGIEVDESTLGSGVLINSNGVIMTNWHVVADAKKIMVKLSNDETRYSARVVTSNEAYDLALISIGGSDHPYLKLEDPDSIKPGDAVIAMGNPFGLSATATTGMISSVRKLKDFPGADKAELTRWQEEIALIQTDAAVNPGNSGGPLLNERGRIVGINTFGIPKSIAEGLNFAIHAKELKKTYSSYFE